MTGFEPATPTSLTWCANRTALHPDVEAVQSYAFFLKRKGFYGFNSPKTSKALWVVMHAISSGVVW